MNEDPNSEGQKLLYEDYRYDKALDMGLQEVYAYHCKRCNYV